MDLKTKIKHLLTRHPRFIARDLAWPFCITALVLFFISACQTAAGDDYAANVTFHLGLFAAIIWPSWLFWPDRATLGSSKRTKKRH